MNGPPQFVLQVPAEVLRLLTGILSGVQRIEAEIREANRRLSWARPPANGAERPSLRVVGPAPDLRDDLREMAAERPRAPGRGRTHTPAGPAAANRMKALQVALGTTGVGLARKLGVSQTTISTIGRGTKGISRKIDEKMRALEGRT